jgi:hypothetical protein
MLDSIFHASPSITITGGQTNIIKLKHFNVNMMKYRGYDVFNATFKNISVISQLSVLLVEET